MDNTKNVSSEGNTRASYTKIGSREEINQTKD
jgi:hypothetical protein